MPLPLYTMGQNQFDTSPLENALWKYAQHQEQQRQNAFRQQQIDMDRTRLGFEGERLGFERERQPLELDRLRLTNAGIPLQQEMTREGILSSRQTREHNARMQPVAYDAAIEANRHMRTVNPLEEQAKLKALEEPKRGVWKEGDVPWVADPTAPDGVRPVRVNLPPNLSKIPEHVAKSASFVTRMVDAEDSVRRVMQQVAERHAQKIKKGFDPTSTQTAVTNLLPEALANLSVRDPEHQRYRQGAEMWIRAFLRKESGAAIGADEFKRDFVVYFPQPGDSKEVLKQKERARHEVMQGFYNEGAPLLSKVNPKVADRLNNLAPTVELPPSNKPQQPNVAPPQPIAPQQKAIPDAAIRDLQSDPSPDAIREFDQVFGPGAAKSILRMR